MINVLISYRTKHKLKRCEKRSARLGAGQGEVMTQQEVVEIFKQTGAWKTKGHFTYTSGRCGTDYLDKYVIYSRPRITSKLCQAITSYFIDNDIQVVIAPAMGGIILSQWVAFHLTNYTGVEVLSTYAEKLPGSNLFAISHNYEEFIRGKRVLVVEDILVTGGSVRKVIRATQLIGGFVVGVGALWNRGNVTFEDLKDALKLFSLVNIKLDSWCEAECPFCHRQ